MKNKTFIKNGVTCKKLGGYIFVQVRMVWVAQHRLIVEEKIGRTLRSEESVHHLNSIKTDNHIENLMLFPTQAEHKSFENKIQQFGKTTNIQRQIRNRWKINTQQSQQVVDTFPPSYNSLGGL